MISSFKHKGLREVWITGHSALVAPILLKKVRNRLEVLDKADNVSQMNVPGFRLHRYHGEDTWSIDVSGSWRILFRWIDGKAEDVTLEQPH